MRKSFVNYLPWEFSRRCCVSFSTSSPVDYSESSSWKSSRCLEIFTKDSLLILTEVPSTIVPEVISVSLRNFLQEFFVQFPPRYIQKTLHKFFQNFILWKFFWNFPEEFSWKFPWSIFPTVCPGILFSFFESFFVIFIENLCKNFPEDFWRILP